MIFVTVGTHEQQFDRLVKCMDDLKASGTLGDEEVIIQTGYSTYEPRYCTWNNFLPYQEMLENVKKARIVITHGGPSSFIMPLQIGKIPIVVPRQIEFDEHVNNHQVNFCTRVNEEMKNILLIVHIEEMKNTIENYDLLVEKLNSKLNSNNQNFNKNLMRILEKGEV